MQYTVKIDKIHSGTIIQRLENTTAKCPLATISAFSPICPKENYVVVVYVAFHPKFL